MATYKVRGNSHNIIFWYIDESEVKKQHWETYSTQLEALQRKVYIDLLEKDKKQDELLQAAMEYKRQRNADKNKHEATTASVSTVINAEDNRNKTYSEFAEKWLQYHARKMCFKPASYDGYLSNLKNHILPYFGNMIMSKITAEDIDDFIDHLTQKTCKNQRGANTHTLSSGAIKKCYSVLTSGFSVAKKWRYIDEIPDISAPSEKSKKRKAWSAKQVMTFLNSSTDDKIIHLAVHIAFVCSLRAGETAGIDLNTINFCDRSFHISQEVQRVSDEALSVLPQNEVLRVFPKQIPTAKTSLILQGPKTEGSYRKQYLTTPLLHEIKDRLEEIDEHKSFFGEEYHDYGLLICKPNGMPYDPKQFGKWFKAKQQELHYEKDTQIDFQGLRKSGQMHKVRLSNNNYQLVAENSGQSPAVLMSNYNEALEDEKRTLSLLVETNFYGTQANTTVPPNDEEAVVLRVLQSHPELLEKLLQGMRLVTTNAR